MKTDIVFENLKIGQEVYSLQYGKGVVKKLEADNLYAIICTFTLSGGEKSSQSFKKDGFFTEYHQLPSLFLTNPFENLNQERVIEVFDGKVWIKRVLVTIKCDVAICWNSADSLELAKSETSTSRWSEWRELQPEQPAAEQPKEITIDGVEYTLMPKNK